MNNFPNSQEEISLLEFIARYQYLSVKDTKYFFNTQKYYKKRISNLVLKKYLRRIKLYLVLDELGIELAELLNFEYNKLNRNRKYLPRLQYISRLAAFYHKCNSIKFTPSFDMKDKEKFTITSRKFIGILEINGIEYLVYHITEQHNNQYISSVLYDIQKEKNFKNIIILINDGSRININQFTFGMNQVLIVEDNEENREKLKYLNSINWYNIIQNQYRKFNIYLTEYTFCQYTDYISKYICAFYFLDTDKINRIKYFLKENKNKNVDIICSKELKNHLQKYLPECNYCTIDIENYIDKEINIYD